MLDSDTFADADDDIDTITVSIPPQYQWLHWDEGKLTFSGTPENADVGDTFVTIEVTDLAGNTTSTQFKVTVDNTNDDPVVKSVPGIHTATVGQSYEETFSSSLITDPDVGDTLTLTAQLSNGAPLPAWLTFEQIGTTTGFKFSGTPALGDVTLLQIEIKATDAAGAWDTGLLTLDVTSGNHAPTVLKGLGDVGIAEDSPLTYTFKADAFFDSDGDTLTYTASYNGGALPSWLSFDAKTRTFTGTPGHGDVKDIDVMVTASDGKASVSDTFTISVVPVNHAPTVNLPLKDLEVTRFAEITYDINVATFADIDAGDTLTYTFSGLPSWLQYNKGLHSFVGKPLSGDLGSHDITVTATDSKGLSVSDTFTVKVVNQAPTGSAFGSLETAKEDTAIFLSVDALTNGFSDPDQDTLSIKNLKIDNGVTYTSTADLIVLSPRTDFFGTVTLTYDIDDGHGGTITGVTRTLTIDAVNDAPVVKAPVADQTAKAGSDFTFKVPNGTFTDVDSSTLTLTAGTAANGVLPSWLSFDAATGTFTGKPAEANEGAVDITLTASDGLLSVSDTFTINVTVANHAPTGTATAKLAAGKEDAAYTVSAANLLKGFTDKEGDTLVVTKLTAGNGAVVAVAGDKFVITPAKDFNGPLTLNYTVSDQKGGITDAVQTVTFQNVNDSPTATSANVKASGTSGTLFTYTIPADLFEDIDGDALTFQALRPGDKPLPSWLTFDPDTRTLSGTPTNESKESLTINLEAFDNNGGFAVSRLSIALGVPNRAPAGTPSAKLSNATEDTAAEVTFASLLRGMSDADGDTLSISALSASDGATVTKTDSGYRIDPAADFNGKLTLTYDVVDGNGGSTTVTQKLVVDAVNDAPVAAVPVPSQTTRAGDVFKFALPAGTFTDVDGDTLSYRATLKDGTALPAWLRIDPVTGVLSGVIDTAYRGPLEVLVKAADNKLSASTTVTINVTEPNHAPTGTPSTKFAAVDEDTTFTITTADLLAGLTDADGDTLTVHSLTAGTNATVTEVTGGFKITPAENYFGTLELNYVVYDGNDGRLSTSQSVTIDNVQDAPRFVEGLLDKTLVMNKGDGFDSADFSKVFTDPDGDQLTYSAKMANGEALSDVFSFKDGVLTLERTSALWQNTYSIEVTASDGTASVSEFVDISVTAEPTWILEGVEEGSAEGHIITRLGKYFDKSDGAITYQISGPGQDALKIDSKGNLRISNPDFFDHEANHNADIVITATRADGKTAVFVETIEILNVYEGYRGTNDDDYIQGDKHDNSLFGKAGSDTLNGGLGSDVLYGGKGDDILQGGDFVGVMSENGAGFWMMGFFLPLGPWVESFGADTFVLGRNSGHDRIEGYWNTSDVIDLSEAAGIDDLEDLMANHLTITEVADGVFGGFYKVYTVTSDDGSSISFSTADVYHAHLSGITDAAVLNMFQF